MLMVNQLIGFGAGGIILPSVSYRGFLTDVVDRTTYNAAAFQAADIGPADPTRVVGAIVCGANNGHTVSSMTIGGVAAAKQVEVVGSANATASLWTALVPTGATGDLFPTWAGGQVRCAIHVFAMYNLTSATKVQSNSSTASTSTLDLSLVSGDVVILGGVSGSAGSVTPTGYTERNDGADAEGEGYSAGDYTAIATESRSISMLWSAGAVFAAVSASFR